ncbi:MULTISPECIES: AarF/ABC1/UbiB kinase family protein [Halorhodospira]|uniref:ABC1 kinase family protein n=1 Tax=Halorhodospira TaxID=85108 RepID=UPI001EE788AE|nr:MULTISPECIES: AarF/ABC1/UbiB kinase family protein [Halorhodospira]MCG5527055.1 AarF/ABC1/UbiB kinase family protein [Halorhodospira halophila]MCG5542608.1 AarF/ABC1/UbiB kinase family protein [Halorhodospira sp. 9628]
MSGSGDERRSRAVPSSRWGRLYHLGRATGDLALGIGWSGLRDLTGGEEGQGRIELSPERARRITDRLGRMRGAVMKMGQLMSMDGTDVLAPEIAEIMGALRHEAEAMPLSQLDSVLRREFGKGWLKRFRDFDFTPVAAASIGQVHRAVAADGRELALKIQFPGVRESIDSDLDNLGFVMRHSGLMPRGLRVESLLDEARRQLHQEADYEAEADALEAYDRALGDDPEITLPGVHRDLTTPRVLAMDYVHGTPVDQLAGRGGEPASLCDHAASLLSRLALRELFEFRLVQTDPNFSNFLYDAERGCLVLLDFGATHSVRPELVETYRRMGRAARDRDREVLQSCARELGYLGPGASAEQEGALLELLEMTSEPLRHQGAYDFGASDLFERVYHRGRTMFFSDRFAGTPASDTLFLHRKFMGTFMLCRRLQARVDLRGLIDPYLADTGVDSPPRPTTG